MKLRKKQQEEKEMYTEIIENLNLEISRLLNEINETELKHRTDEKPLNVSESKTTDTSFELVVNLDQFNCLNMKSYHKYHSCIYLFVIVIIFQMLKRYRILFIVPYGFIGTNCLHSLQFA